MSLINKEQKLFFYVKILLVINMRIISGIYKGSKIEGYDIIGTRPTMDRVKESLFGIIQNNVKDSVCLDLFAGSGSLGLEALSNGASTCYFVDKNKQVIEILNKNISRIKIENTHVLQNNYLESLKQFVTNNIRFDIIFLDPPYNDNLIQPSINFIVENNLLNEDGLIVCEYEKELFTNDKLTEIKSRAYGNKNIKILKITE
jgi:16S rRNA (guanine966-N2)-methyltransferase